VATSPSKPSVALLLPAAGLGTRMGTRKTLLGLAGKPLVIHTLERFLPFRDQIVQTILIVHPDDADALTERCGDELQARFAVTHVVPGGATRQKSVRAGLGLVSTDADLVAIHDAVRPFVSSHAVAEAFEAAEQVGAAIVATPVKPTVKRVADGRIEATIDRTKLWCAQTPQVFRRSLILEAIDAASREGLVVTDDAQLVERLGHPVAIVPGSELNLKITTPQDLALAEAILASGVLTQ